MNEYDIEKIKIESRTLDARLANITLSQEEINKVTKEKSLKTLREEGLNLFGPIGKVTNLIMGWHEEMEDQLKETKERRLMEGYFNKTDEQVDVINQLKNFVTDPYGFTIFSKIRAILDDAAPDSELIDHLSTVLKNIVNAGYYEALFEKTKYVLGQIERLTPQSLTILADEDSWPTFEMSASTYMGGKISSEFHEHFGEDYAKKKGVTDPYKVKRIVHSVRELQNANLIAGHKVDSSSRKNINECRLTEIGTEVVHYLK